MVGRGRSGVADPWEYKRAAEDEDKYRHYANAPRRQSFHSTVPSVPILISVHRIIAHTHET